MIFVIHFVILLCFYVYIMGRCEHCIIRHFNALKVISKVEAMRVSQCKTSQIIKKGTVLFEEGSYIDGVFCIKEGACKLTKLSSNGKNQIIKLLKRGDLIGQRSIINDEPVNLTATALSDMRVCFIPKEEMLNAVKSNLDFSTELIRDVCHDLKDANNAIVNMAQYNVAQRLASALLYLNNTFGNNEKGYMEIQLSREEIANMIGTATESAIRLLSGFKRDGLIELNGKKIKITNAKKLESLINSL